MAAYFGAWSTSCKNSVKTKVSHLFAGRAFSYHHYPFCAAELGDQFDLELAIRFGGLPEIFSLKSDEDRSKFLRGYVKTYLQTGLKDHFK
jgi:predicted AAA+ superfamily ATPase